MKVWRVACACLVAATLLSGCGTFKKLTGKRDDTVLPGQREDVLPADQQRLPRPGKDAANADSFCDPTVDATCAQQPDADPSIDQEAAGDGLQ
jgi:hypothetical protein